ncbi:DctP family TRAP transporter solute-binding subunit [Oceanidesulfovibrio marinus]|uniref:C4-dicarboxylate ABC transporter substrate-binding protein n=1 Tax=Oceanidesulfovibrio marinus TaxID=370038 RepID=A0A6P1ZLW4_9BACT|nr:DctP family TRAP transporter solute-binding subunit [Oceanidesulfovibrio marinus]QJT08777.1 DctP family TRAP transporter solute-binding subunit [Oceanidesulfovibrio marinus]TVM36796.1 C4-dicarboxylate ABC transporter substrate-binding protein [Oceanidesulfovibrio marinus]
MKRLLTVFAAVLLAVALSSSAFADPVAIRIANSGPDKPGNRTVKAGQIFMNVAKTMSNGELDPTFYHASQLGAEREALEGVQIGTIEMATLSGGPVPGFFPEVMVFDIPYLFSSNAAAWEFFNSDFMQKFKDEFVKKTGVRILAITENGFRHFTNKKNPIHVPADLKGLKVRTMQNPAHMAMVQAMGADPTPIAFSELYMALQQGVVDAMECPIALIHDMKFYEVQDYMVLDGHLYNPLFVFVNESFYQGLSDTQKKALDEASKQFAIAHCAFNQEANGEALKNLADQGMEIYHPTAEDLTKFRDIAQPAGLKYIREKIGDEWVDAALKAAAEAEATVAGKEDAIVQEYIDTANKALAEAQK